MTEDNKNQEQLSIQIVVCRSCDKEIKPNDDKHCFWYEDIEDAIKPECLDCHLNREAIIRDFGF